LVDQLEKITTPEYPCDAVIEDDINLDTLCEGMMKRVWLQGSANGVVDDSIPGGLEIKNALCHPDGTPKRYDSHSDIKRAAAAAGWTNAVTHIGARGSDKSKHTVSHDVGPAPGCDPRPFFQLSPEEQKRRHEEWMKTEPLNAPK
jgi:hypothetical protein